MIDFGQRSEGPFLVGVREVLCTLTTYGGETKHLTRRENEANEF